MTDFQEKCLSKIDNGEKLTEDELSTLVWEHSYETEELERYWFVTTMRTIVELNGRYFRIKWSKGMVKQQPHEYGYQPEEVEKRSQLLLDGYQSEVTDNG